MKKSTFSLLFIIKKTKLLSNGEAPICLRVTVQGQMTEIHAKRSVPAHLWNQAKECSNGKDYAAKELNHYLETIKTRIYQIQREMEIDGKIITANSIRDRYLGKDVDSKTLCQVYAEHNKKCRNLIGIDFTLSTVDKFDTSLSHLKEYIKYQYRKDDILLSEVNGQFVSDFDYYLKTVKRCMQNTCIKHHKNLKKVLRIAIANEWMKKDPYMNFKFRYDEPEIEFLSREELDAIITKEIHIKRLAQVRDIFVFCCFTGLAFIDTKQLTPQYLSKDENGDYWIRKPRQKTGVMSRIPLLPVPLQIIRKYANHPDCIKKGVLLPVASNQKMNTYLKELADVCGITKKLSTHVARHTCATVVMLANKVSLVNVSKILGHSSTKMTEHYAKVLDQSINMDVKGVGDVFSGVNMEAFEVAE